MEYKNWSVGVIITNPKRTLFYIQQKDESYFVPEYRLKHCFFGGNIDKGENEFNALKRELKEELNEEFADKITANTKRLFNTYFINILKQHFKHTLYESIISDSDLKKLSVIIPNEGRSTLVDREGFEKLAFFTDLKEARRLYLKGIE